ADSTGPSLSVPTTGLVLGCNPGTLPTVSRVVAASRAHDACSASTFSATHTDSTTGCVTTRDFMVIAKDACLNQIVAHVVYSWTRSAERRVGNERTTGLVLGCNTGTLPTDPSVVAASSANDTCSPSTVSATHT